MKRLLRVCVLIAVGVAGAAATASSQVLNIIRPRMRVDSPAAIAGFKPVTTTATSDNWLEDVDMPYTNIPVAKGYDSLGCAGLTNPADVNGKAVLIFRGTCNFTQKVRNAQDAGAILVLIVNNTASPLLLNMGYTTGTFAPPTIPGVMMTQADGLAMNAQLLAGADIRITLTPYGFGLANDLAAGDKTNPLPHALAIPFSQLTAGTTPYYKMYPGALVGNTGTANQTAVEVKVTTSFTPASGGSATVLRNDSITVPVITTADSLGRVLAQVNGYNINTVPSTGTVNTFYRVSSSNSDEEPSNDTFSGYPLMVTDSIFSKARYNMTTNGPTVTIGYRASTGVALGWGPLYYVQKGGYQAAKAQFAISIDGGGSLAGTTPVTVYLFKWVDGRVAEDSVVQGGELIVQGVGTYSFVSTDTSFDVVTVPLTDPYETSKPALVEGSSMYYVGLQLPASVFLGCDGDVNYHSRAYATHGGPEALSYEYSAPITSASLADFAGDTLNGNADYFGMFPFPDGGSSFYPDSLTYLSQQGLVPAITLHLSKNLYEAPTESIDRPNLFNDFQVYPNPATDRVEVKVGFTKAVKTCAISVADAFGRQAMAPVLFSGVSSKIQSFNTAYLPAGQYYMVVATDEGTSVRQFLVVHK